MTMLALPSVNRGLPRAAGGQKKNAGPGRRRQGRRRPQLSPYQVRGRREAKQQASTLLGTSWNATSAHVQGKQRKRGGGSNSTRRVTKMGLPILGWMINPFTLSLAYFIGAVKFASGFSRTSYSNNLATKITLAALWPALYAVNPSFRKNFKRAM